VWLEHYYNDVPLLQSKIKSLENQVTVLTSQRDKLQVNDKKQKTTGSIVFRNVESTTSLRQFQTFMTKLSIDDPGMNFDINFILSIAWINIMNWFLSFDKSV
jgi:hypothetical protein